MPRALPARFYTEHRPLNHRLYRWEQQTDVVDVAPCLSLLLLENAGRDSADVTPSWPSRSD